MTRNKFLTLGVVICFTSIILFNLCVSSSSASDMSVAGNDLYLFSLQDAELLNHEDDKEWGERPIVMTKGNMGPIVNLKNPLTQKKDKYTIVTNSPLNLLVFFVNNYAPIDMDSLKVIARKGFLKKDLTQKIKPFITGLSINAPSLKIPSGKFKILISVADNQGNSTKAEYRLIVTD